MGGLSLEGGSWHKQPGVSDEVSLGKFFHPKEEPMHMCGDLSREDLSVPYCVVCYAIMQYAMLQDHFQVLYYYHFPILNHELISFPPVTLHSMEDWNFNVLKKRENGKSFYVIHQAFMLNLYKSRQALNPPFLVNPFFISTPQVSSNSSPGWALKKSIIKSLGTRKDISVIDSYIDTSTSNKVKQEAQNRKKIEPCTKKMWAWNP